jgi:signal transduction histidine kinase
MHPKYLDNVFEEHFTHRKGGTGYGLFAAKEYVSSIGGEIEAATEERVYFEVTIVLDEYSSRGRIADDTASVFAPDTLRLHSVKADR